MFIFMRKVHLDLREVEWEGILSYPKWYGQEHIANHWVW